MKLIIFGATGGTGQQVVTQALAQGHNVTAFVRRPEAVTTQHANLTIVQGNITDAAVVAGAVAGHEAVLSALGTRGDDKPVLPEGTHNILVAMEQAGIRRSLWVSSFGVGDSQQQMGWIARTVIVNLFLKNAIAEKEIQERYIRESAGDWIIARPGGLTNGPLTGTYRVTGPGDKVGRPSISRADVADFMLKNLADDRYIRKAVGLTY
jgi:putative NADH-flavin reductase